MIKWRRSRGKSFSTVIKGVEVLDDDDTYCEDNYGFIHTEEGIEALPVISAVEPDVSISNVAYADYLPALGYGVLITKYGQVYKWNTGEFSTPKSAGLLSSVFPTVTPLPADGENAYLAISGLKGGILKKETFESFSTGVKLGFTAYHCGRIFAVDGTDKYVLRWSSYDCKIWTEGVDGGGHMRLSARGGEIVSLCSFGDYLIVVRDTELNILRALGDSRHFRLEPAKQYGLPPIAGGSCVICGGQLWFYADGSLYSFDGGGLQRRNFKLYGREFVPDCARAYKNRYILFSGKSGSNNCLVEYDTELEKCAPFALGCNLPFIAGDKFYCFNGRQLSVLKNNVFDSTKRWKSVKMDLGTRAVKTLKRVRYEGEGNSALVVNCDGRTRIIQNYGLTYFGERGVDFTFTVMGAGKIKRIYAEWETGK